MVAPAPSRLSLSPIGEALLRAGRNEGPRVLYSWWILGRISDDDLRRQITHVWQLAEWPARSLGVATWVEMFRAVGFVSDTDSPAPTSPVRLFRGATWGRRRGMSWTKDPMRAGWFAGRYPGAGGLVFAISVDPSAVLALVGDPEGRNEDEVVVDPSLLGPITRTNIVDDLSVAIAD